MTEKLSFGKQLTTTSHHDNLCKSCNKTKVDFFNLAGNKQS